MSTPTLSIFFVLLILLGVMDLAEEYVNQIPLLRHALVTSHLGDQNDLTLIIQVLPSSPPLPLLGFRSPHSFTLNADMVSILIPFAEAPTVLLNKETIQVCFLNGRMGVLFFLWKLLIIWNLLSRELNLHFL